MTYTASLAAKHYAQVGLESGVMSASPHQLIVLLYEGAEQAVRLALRHMHNGDLAAKAVAVSKADSIIQDGLRAALDPDQGGKLAGQLESLYDYMSQRITLAHVRNDPAPLEEVLGLLRELREAWLQIGAASRAPQKSAHSIAA